MCIWFILNFLGISGIIRTPQEVEWSPKTQCFRTHNIHVFFVWLFSVYTKYGQESPGWISLFKYVTLKKKFQKLSYVSISLVNLIGQWIPKEEEQGITRDIRKNHFHFWTLQKRVTMLGQFAMLMFREGSRPCKLSQFSFHL